MTRPWPLTILGQSPWPQNGATCVPKTLLKYAACQGRKTPMKIKLFVVMVVGLIGGADANEPGFTPLFDGETLAGWEGNEGVFRVQDGAIVAGSTTDKVAHNEFLASKEDFGDFELRLKARLAGKGQNAGVQFRSQRIPNHFEMIGYQ